MKAWQKYFETINSVVQKIEETQGENIMKAATLMANATEKGGLIYAFGCWHSLLIAEENYYRAASPANFVAVSESSVNGTFELTKIGRLENCYGIGNTIVDYHRMSPNDVLICISNSGNNIVTVDACLRAKEKGIPTIAITSTEYGDCMKTRHEAGVKLKDIADVVLDNNCIVGDAAVKLEGFPVNVGPVSGIPMNYLLSSTLVQMSEILIERGIQPEVYYNGHVKAMTEEAKAKFDWLEGVDAEKHNNDLIDKYFYRIKSL